MTTQDLKQYFRAEVGALFDAREAEAVLTILLQEVLNYSTVDAVLRNDFEQPQLLCERFCSCVQRLKRHEPIQYVVGKARFHGHTFKVTPATLIPRPETERLVDIIVDENNRSDLRVLDIGTGSGCIAIALARALKFAQVTAIDVSADALNVARENALTLKARIDFKQEDILTAKPEAEAYDLIVSNPPYICESERATMEPHVTDFEPGNALFVPDNDPLLFYRAIAEYAAAALVPNGKLYLEINARFGAQVATLLRQYAFTQVRVLNDPYGRVRYVTACI